MPDTPYGVAGCRCWRWEMGGWTDNTSCPYHGLLPRDRTDTGVYRVVDIDPGSVERNIRKGEEWIAQRRTPDDAYAALHDAGCNHQSCDHVWDPRDGRIKTYEEARRDDTSPTVSQGDDRVIVDVDAIELNRRHATEGVDTPGCDCGHNGMARTWHRRPGCAWIDTDTDADACGACAHYGRECLDCQHNREVREEGDSVPALLSPGGVACTGCDWTMTGGTELEQIGALSAHLATHTTEKKEAQCSSASRPGQKKAGFLTRVLKKLRTR